MIWCPTYPNGTSWRIGFFMAPFSFCKATFFLHISCAKYPLEQYYLTRQKEQSEILFHNGSVCTQCKHIVEAAFWTIVRCKKNVANEKEQTIFNKRVKLLSFESVDLRKCCHLSDSCMHCRCTTSRAISISSTMLDGRGIHYSCPVV